MKPIFRTDLCLVIVFAASLLTGIKIHYANDFQTHDIWHTWSVIHFFVNIAILATAIIHIKQHWGWFKTLFKASSFTLKSKITMLVAILFLATSITGVLLLLFIDGQGSSIGMVHYVIGLIFGAIGLGHFIKRWKVFKKGVAK